MSSLTVTTRAMRRALAGACAAGITMALLPVTAGAQGAYPNRPVKMIIPFAAGSGNDPVARGVATRLAVRLGQPVVVDNRGGAGGTIATDAVAKAPADGYTILFGAISMTTNVASGKKLPYDLLKDLAPIGQVGEIPLLISVAKDSKAQTLKELVDMARAKPGSVHYPSGGVGSFSHLGTEVIADVAKTQLVHVPYKSQAIGMTDLISGQLHMAVLSPPGASPHLQAGNIRVLATTGKQRSPMVPSAPTVAEAGFPAAEMTYWWGLLTTAGTPPAIIKRLNDELNFILTQPEFKEFMLRESATPRPGTPQEFGKLIASEVDRWTKLVKDANIKIE